MKKSSPKKWWNILFCMTKAMKVYGERRKLSLRKIAKIVFSFYVIFVQFFVVFFFENKIISK